jgi:hypothetical protein
MTISVMLILGALVAMFIVKDGLNKFQAIVLILFGIYLGDTAFGGNLHGWTDNLFSMISQMNF